VLHHFHLARETVDISCYFAKIDVITAVKIFGSINVDVLVIQLTIHCETDNSCKSFVVIDRCFPLVFLLERRGRSVVLGSGLAFLPVSLTRIDVKAWKVGYPSGFL